jgi:hypothetical protein
VGGEAAATHVRVEPGVYPLYRYHDAVYWLMSGRVTGGGGFEKIGDGLFLMGGGDEGDGPEVVFPSRRFGPEEWAEFRAEPACAEGDSEQRLRVVEGRIGAKY